MAPPKPVRRVLHVAAVLCGGAALGVGMAQAQQLIGYVKADDANVTGATDVMDGQAVLAGSVSVTAKDHTAVITLGRGGLARVCQTSALHLTESKGATAGTKVADAATPTASAGGSAPGGAVPLLFSLDRGAVEVRMNGLANDSIMTPDLRMTVHANGPLDVRLRVARNGDTCVENRGAAAPTLAVSDPFGESQYELMPGQHVLFEHGDLREVVDHEAEPCGCPDEKGSSVADALLAPAGSMLGAPAATTPAVTELQHPFPAAVSEGLAPAASANEANPAQPQVTAELRYNANTTPNAAADTIAPSGGAGAAGSTANNAAGDAASSARNHAAPAIVAAVPSSAVPVSLGTEPPVRQEPVKAPEQPPELSPNRDLVHLIGHFFRSLFRH